MSPTLDQHTVRSGANSFATSGGLVPVAFGGNNTSGSIDVATAVRAHAGAHYDFESETFIATTLRARDGSKGVDSDCTDTLVPVAFDTTQITSPANYSQPREGDPCHPLAAGAHPPALAFAQNQLGEVRTGDVSGTLNSNGNATGRNSPLAMHHMRVRRLTPRECERLQGFPDDHTLVPHRGKPAADGPRYKAIGNSMAVPVMAWIGRRIKAMENSL